MPTTPGLYERYTIHHHVRAVAGQGVVAGTVLLNEYVARKGLGASRPMLLLLLLVPSLAQFVAATWNPADPSRRMGRAPFRLLGIPSRALLLLFLLPAMRSAGPFVAVMAVVLSVEALLLPVQNWTLAHNYQHATRARRFGMTTAVQALVIIAVVLPGGWALDRWPEAWPLLYALAAAGGIYGYAHWSRLRRRWRSRARTEPQQHRPWRLLFSDRRFLLFEAGFMIYGLGFLMLQPVLPLYLVDELHVSYGQVALARGLLFWLGMSLASPVAARVADAVGMLRTCAASFAVLTCFPLVLLLVKAAWALDVAYLVYGVAMGGVNLAWNLGPITIARGRDPLAFLNAHVALVGIRAVVGMPLGMWIQASVGTRAVFWLVIALEIAAAAVMLKVGRDRHDATLGPGEFEQPKAPAIA